MSLHFVPLHEDYEGMYGLYIPETMAIYRVSAQQKTLWEKDPAQFSEQDLNPQNGARPQFYEEAPGFDTLILHISNDCNLRCGYCFAGHGSYISAPGMMTEETAVRALETYLRRYGRIREVKLFGGEPLLNPAVMEAVGQYVSRLEFAERPVIKVITNGTIMTERIMKIIRDYGIKTVFSIDGEKAVHDRGRFYADGSGTFQRVCENFEKLREYTGGRQPYSIDATYTHLHEQQGMSINDVVWFLTERFGVEPQKVNLSVVTVAGESAYALKRKEDPMIISAADALLRAYHGDYRPHMKLKAVIRRLKNRMLPPQTVCPACKTWAAVSSTGKVYPCLMFMDREEYCMGQAAPGLFETESYRNIRDRFQCHKKREVQPCSSCFARMNCSMCMGINEFYTGQLTASSPEQCRQMQKMTDIVIQGIAEEVW